MRIKNKLVAFFTLLASIPVLLLYYAASVSTDITLMNADSSSDPGPNLNVLVENQKLKTQLRELMQRIRFIDTDCKNSTDSNHSCQVIHVCIVSAGYKAARELTTLIKSLMLYRHDIIHLHLIVDSIALPILNTLLKSWNIPSMLYSFYSTASIEPSISWIPNAHYSGIFGLMKLQVPYVLPSYVEKVILLDTDLVLADDIANLWSQFKLFSAGQFFGIVENLSDWYLPESSQTSWPALGRGYNTGVVLMNVKTMRETRWNKLWREIANKYLPVSGPTKLADQDIINAVIKDHPHVVYTLPCTWNVQITNRATFEPFCYDVNEAQVLHFNSPDKYNVYFGSPKKDSIADYFKSFYYMFVQYDGNLLKHKATTKHCPDSSANSSLLHPTISMLLEQNQEVLAACYEVEGIRQSSQGRLHIYYLPYNHTVVPSDITLVAQFSMDRLGVLELLATYWSGPMSLCLYLSDSEAQQFYDFVMNSAVLSSRTNIGYHVVFKTGMHYPVNYLRNIAIDQSVTDFVFLTDIDFVPMMGLYEYLKDACRKHDIENNKLALVVPAFETQQYRPEMPADKQDLMQFLANNLIQIFRHDVWPKGHDPTNYTRWYNSSEPYIVNWQPDYEPYIAVSKNIVPKYDERFFGFGWNKVSHIMEVDAQGFKMMVLPHAFIIHAPHSPSLDISQYRSSSAYRNCLQTLKKEFQKELSHKYGIRALKYLSS